MVCPYCGSEKEIFIKGKYFCENCGLEKKEAKIESETLKEETGVDKKEPEKKVESELSGVFSQMAQQLNIPQEEKKEQKGVIDTVKPPFKVKVKEDVKNKKESALPKTQEIETQVDKNLTSGVEKELVFVEKTEGQPKTLEKDLENLVKTPEIQSPITSKEEVEEPDADIKKEDQEIEKLEVAEKVLDVLEHEIPIEAEKPTEEKGIEETEEILEESKEEILSENIPQSIPEVKSKPKSKPKSRRTRKPRKAKLKYEEVKKPSVEEKLPSESTEPKSLEEETDLEKIQSYSEVFNNDFTKGWLEQDVDTKEIKKPKGEEKEEEPSPNDLVKKDLKPSSVLSSENKDIQVADSWPEEKMEIEEETKDKAVAAKKVEKNELVTSWFKNFEKELSSAKEVKSKSKKRGRKKKKSLKKILIAFLIIFIILFLITGLVLYVNLVVNNPEVALQKAESSLSFPIKKPERLPPGYELTAPVIINRKKTSIILTYKYLPDESKKIIFTQSQSQWTDQDLYNNYVSTNTREYTQKEFDGKLIYIMDKKKATWIADNLWFLLEIDADNVTPEELVKIATSIK